MTIHKFQWHDEEKTILIVTVDPSNWRWDDAYAVIEQQVALMEALPHTVHTIFTFTTSPRMPTKDKNTFTHLRNLMNTRAKNEGLSIFVGTNKLFSTLITAAGRLNHLKWLIDKYRYVITFDQALAAVELYTKNDRREVSRH